MTYAEAENSTSPQPYIAAVVWSNENQENMFVLGDGRNTSDSTAQKRSSTSRDYYNGPLQPDTSYCIFQRIIISEKVSTYGFNAFSYFHGKETNLAIFRWM